MLLEREGKIVTRKEIKSRLWLNDTVVDFDHSINATIKTLRRALVYSANDAGTTAFTGAGQTKYVCILCTIQATQVERRRLIFSRRT